MKGIKSIRDTHRSSYSWGACISNGFTALGQCSVYVTEFFHTDSTEDFVSVSVHPKRCEVAVTALDGGGVVVDFGASSRVFLSSTQYDALRAAMAQQE